MPLAKVTICTLKYYRIVIDVQSSYNNSQKSEKTF
jgi:hypothetical protein